MVNFPLKLILIVFGTSSNLCHELTIPHNLPLTESCRIFQFALGFAHAKKQVAKED
jgi:hypothetical protein